MPSLASRLLLALLVLAVLLPAAQANAQAARTWVSGVGDDVNPCSRTAPCKTLAGSIGKTAAGGEINAIDAGGFGSVTITKAITIDLRNVQGGVLATGTTGIWVNAGPSDDVILRGLAVHGGSTGGAAPCTSGRGISVLQARSVRVEDTTIERFGTGIAVTPAAADTEVFIDGVGISNVCGAAVDVAPGAGRSVSALVRHTSITRSGTGLRVATGGVARLADSSLFANALGLSALGTGVLTDLGGNTVVGNADDGAYSAPPAAPVAPAAAPTAAAAATPVKPVVAASTAAARCVVPKLAGLKLAAAKSKLKRAGCTLGKVTYRTTRSTKRAGRVATQKLKASSLRSAKAAVAITVWRRART